ncbi:ComEC/Rec2 family competence protein [Nocardiopsis ansamitocini]|uniref:Membrane protein n=1 Tax=Nocardiopsis ansamitocini TaxID=1670832 RepID=A0A9W6P3K0_9ACTN|nr:ComEC/Rec2 family competence protein [Nocardiopsis ansamitocini]GLU46388.1 membrane protein [Nocardiopsis ansamitocini]
MSYLGTDSPVSPGRADARLCAPAVGLWASVLVSLGLPAWASLGAGVGLGVVALALVPLLRAHRPPAGIPLLAAVVVCAAGGTLVVAGRTATLERSPVAQLAQDERHAHLGVRLTRDPRPRVSTLVPGRAEFTVEATTEWVTVDGTRVPSRVPVVLLTHGEEWRDLVPSQRMQISGRIVPGGEDGLMAGLVLVRGPPAEVGAPSAAHAWAALARARLRETCAVLPRPEQGLLPALVVGDVSRLDEETSEVFRATGMTHLLTVSGANLAVMTGAALGSARLLRLPNWCAVAMGAGMIAVFVLLARPEPSVLRAAFMGAVALLGIALGRPRIGLAALSASVIGLLLFAPELAASHGFALSVLATGGILLLAPTWRDTWSARLPRWLAEAIAVTLAAQVACLPVLVLLSAEVNWVSVPANVLAGPAVPVATVGGFAVAGLGLFAPRVAQSVVEVPGAAVGWIAAVAHTGAAVPVAALPWRADGVGALLLAGVVAVLLAARGWLRRALGALAGSVAGAVLLVTCTAPDWPPPGWVLVACDVGQGDAFVLAAGGDQAIVVDAGVDPRAVDRCLRTLGVRDVVLLVLTHDDADHVGGTAGVLRGRAVHSVFTPPGFDSPAVTRALAGAGTERHTVAAGQRFVVGPWQLTVLWPSTGTGGDSNNRSLVVLARWVSPVRTETASSFSVLLTGDIGESAQRGLLTEPATRSVDVLKTPHHGARSQSARFLSATRPRITLTSVGTGNRYGHPAPEVWALLEGLTPASYRTDVHGDIAVLPGTGAPAVTWRGPLDR